MKYIFRTAITAILSAAVLCTAVGAACIPESGTAVSASPGAENTAYMNLSETEHRYTVPQFHWSRTAMTCLASWSCTVCGVSETADCTVTADDSQHGQTVYTAAVTVGGTVYTDTNTVEDTADIHEYGVPEIIWSADNQTAQAYAVCSLCPAGSPAKTVTAPCTVTSLTEPPTCTSDGWVQYSAYAVLLGTPVEDRKTVVLPQLQHTYTVPQFHWNGELCDASYSCTVDGTVFLEACHVESQTLYQNCADAGCQRYTAGIVIGGIRYTDTKEVALPPKGHRAVRIDGAAPTCTEDGYSDSIVCADCHFVMLEPTVLRALGHTELHLAGTSALCETAGLSDGSICSVCNTVITEQIPLPPLGHTPVRQSAAAPTCTEPGYTEGSVCAACGQVLLASTEIPAAGHRYSRAEFIWSHDGMTVHAVKTCQNHCGTSLSGTVTLTRSEQTENGHTVTVVTADAVFPDGTTARDVKKPEPSMPSDSDTASPDRPTAPLTPPPSQDGSSPGNALFSAAGWAARAGITQEDVTLTFSADAIQCRIQVLTILRYVMETVLSDTGTASADVASACGYAALQTSVRSIIDGTAGGIHTPALFGRYTQRIAGLLCAAEMPSACGNDSLSDSAAVSWLTEFLLYAQSEK